MADAVESVYVPFTIRMVSGENKKSSAHKENFPERDSLHTLGGEKRREEGGGCGPDRTD